MTSMAWIPGSVWSLFFFLDLKID